MAHAHALLDRWIGIAGTSKIECELLHERLSSLKRQLPWLYAILFANLVGFHLTVRQEAEVSSAPALVFLTVIAVRAVHWLRLSRPIGQADEFRRELRSTFLVCVAFSIAFCAWSLKLCWTLSGPHRIDIVMFATLTALGSSYALVAFPAAARVPLLILGLPLALSMAISSQITHAGMGISLAVLILLTLRLLKGQDRAFARLIYSRFAIAAEKQRAVDAQKLAIAEQARARLMANSDALTGLANRRGFLGSLDDIESADRRKFALILVDLDGFKPINDTFGHASGDALLVEVSRRLQAVDGRRAIVARLGGDEFAIACACAHAEEAVSIARQLVAAVTVPFSIDGRTLSISACAGVSFQSDDDLQAAMRRADIALYRSKDCGRGHVALFTGDMEQDAKRRTSIEQALREPGIDQDIEIAFQPIFELETMEICSFEALARWRHPQLGWISPAEFIPITEQMSVLDSMNDALLRRAANAANQWPDRIRLSFNLSAVHLSSAGYGARIISLLEDAEFDATRLQLEVTETALLADFQAARDNLSALGARGVSILLDDFGAGYSSISYLREMNLEAVKLDGSLLALGDGTGGLPLLRGVLALCEAIGLPCVAEHIESQQQLDILKELRCQFGQGFLLSPPLDRAAAVSLAWSATRPRRARAAA